MTASFSPRRALALLIAVAFAWLSGCAERSPAPAAPTSPVRLAVVIVIDQLGTARLEEPLTGGFRRLLDEGRFFADAVLDHAAAETCPGHVAVVTGRHPSTSGIPGNLMVEEGRAVYCVEDPRPEVRVLGGRSGRSPRLIRVDALGDWLREANALSRVYAVSAKDRASIMLGGEQPHAAYWLGRTEPAGFTSSAYYLDALPAWIEEWNRDPLGTGFLAEVPALWTHSADAPPPLRADDYVGESERFSRTSGHPVRGEDLAESLERLYWSPFVDDVTLDFARELIVREQLGVDDSVDLLLLSLSGTDLVGHLYGPASHEARDALQRLDRSLGDFLDFLDAQVGTGRFALAVTSDHGVLPLPEWLEETGRNRCPGDSGRIFPRVLFEDLAERMAEQFGVPVEIAGQWFRSVGHYAALNQKLITDAGLETKTVLDAAVAFFMGQPAVKRVWRRAELEVSGPIESDAYLYHNSYDAERSGDLLLQLHPTCLLSRYEEGTSHGTPYLYDRAVPLIFTGPGIESGTVPGRAATVDLAPTLAHYLGLPAPDGLDGTVLPLRD